MAAAVAAPSDSSAPQMSEALRDLLAADAEQQALADRKAAGAAADDAPAETVAVSEPDQQVDCKWIAISSFHSEFLLCSGFLLSKRRGSAAP